MASDNRTLSLVGAKDAFDIYTGRNINRNRFPTLLEILNQRTETPADLNSFYTYVREQTDAIDYLDFWLDITRHTALCRYYVRQLRDSMAFSAAFSDPSTPKNFNLDRDSMHKHKESYSSMSSFSSSNESSLILESLLRDTQIQTPNAYQGDEKINNKNSLSDDSRININSASNTKNNNSQTRQSSMSFSALLKGENPNIQDALSRFTHMLHASFGGGSSIYRNDEEEGGKTPKTAASSRYPSMAASDELQRHIRDSDACEPMPPLQNVTDPSYASFARSTSPLAIPSTARTVVHNEEQNQKFNSKNPFFSQKNISISPINNNNNTSNHLITPPSISSQKAIPTNGEKPMHENSTFSLSPPLAVATIKGKGYGGSHGRTPSTTGLVTDQEPYPDSTLEYVSNGASNPRDSITRQELRASTWRIMETYLVPDAPRKLALPDFIIRETVSAIEVNARDDPEIFEDAREYVFQAIELDIFPHFLQSLAFGNLSPLGRILRASMGFLALFGGFWLGFVFIFMDWQPKRERAVVLLPFFIGWYFSISTLYSLDPVLAFLGYSECGEGGKLKKVKDRFIKNLLCKRALVVLSFVCFFAAGFTLIFTLVPGRRLTT